MPRRAALPSRRQRAALVPLVAALAIAGLLAALTRDHPRPLEAVGASLRGTVAEAPDPSLPNHAVPSSVPEVLPAADAPPTLPAARPPTPTGAGTEPARPQVRQPPPRPNRAAAPASAPAPAPQSHARFAGDFPDPSLLAAGGTYWAFGTQSGLTQIQVLSSTDLLTWEHRGDALGRLPSWAEWGWAWAPSVLARPTGFVLYYTTRHAATGLQCISRATSIVPQGPYLDASTEPLVCQFDRGGSIDPQPFVDVDGSTWLLWKSEGTLDGEPTRIWVRRLTDDGLALQGAAFELLATASRWEHPIIEGPAMVRVGGTYHLLYAGNRWETADYAIGHARCASVTGPCTRVGDGRLLGSDGSELGPGSPAPLTLATGEVVLGYHAWTAPAVGYPEGARRLHLARLTSSGDALAVTRPWSPPSP